MAKCRIGHIAEAQILQAIEIDYIDESEVLSPADDIYHINKNDFSVPFVCGAKDLRSVCRSRNPARRKVDNGKFSVLVHVDDKLVRHAKIFRLFARGVYRT